MYSILLRSTLKNCKIVVEISNTDCHPPQSGEIRVHITSFSNKIVQRVAAIPCPYSPDNNNAVSINETPATGLWHWVIAELWVNGSCVDTSNKALIELCNP